MEGACVALALTLKVAGWATFLNVFLGIGAGYALARWRFVGRDLLDAVLTLPMVMPPTVLGYYLLVLIGSQGVVGAWLLQHFGIRLIFTWQAAVIAATVVSFPLVFKAARAAFETVDAQLEDAARSLGVGEVAIFFRVSLPLAWRGILAGLLLSFARALGEFGATITFAGNFPGTTQTMPLATYLALESNPDEALILSLVLIAVSFAVLVGLRDRWLGGAGGPGAG